MNNELPETQNQLFTNCFSLTLSHSKIEEVFEEKIGKNKIAMIIFVAVEISIICSGLTLLNTLDLTSVDLREYQITCFYGYLNSFIVGIALIFFLFHFKYSQVVSPFLYINFISMQLSLLFFHEYMNVSLGSKLFFHKFDLIVVSMEFLLMLCYILFFDNNFLRLFVSMVINYSTYVTILIKEQEKQENANIIRDNLINCGCTLIIQLVVYYIWCRSSKLSFYYKEKLEIETNWIYDILNNWNSGVIVYNQGNRKIKFINDYLKKYDEFRSKNYNSEDIPLIRSNNSSNIFVGTELNNLNNLLMVENYNSIYGTQSILNKFNIFNHIFDINKDLPIVIRNAFLLNDFQEIIDSISNYYTSELENIFFKEFVFLGHVNLNSGNNKGIFEISIHGFHNYQGYYYEIMINDVSKTKEVEEETIKEKTLLLGKISHEFKNPLIVIDEVIDQVIEIEEVQGIQSKKQKEQINKMCFVKNLCSYMLILVKDFEVVASLENCLEIEPVNETLELRPFLLEIGQIIETLIIKKSSTILFFKLSINEYLKKINIDTIRLKQILINLLSNSVKFTGMGLIELKVEVLNIYNSKALDGKEDDNINIKDTHFQLIENNEDVIKMKDVTCPDEKENNTDNDIIIVRFSVIDSGKGLSDDLINLINSDTNVNVFQKDTTASNSLGTGYGLNIVQRLSKVLGSKINASHREDCLPGSVFYFDLHLKKDRFSFISSNVVEGFEINNQLMEDIALLPNNKYIEINKTIIELKNEENDPIDNNRRSPLKSSSKNKYGKLVFDNFPSKYNNTTKLFKSQNISSHVSNVLNNFPNEKAVIPIEKINNSNNIPFHNILKMPVEEKIEFNNNCFRTIKRIHEINLPRKFFQYDKDNKELEQDVIKDNENIKDKDIVSNSFHSMMSKNIVKIIILYIYIFI